MVTKLINLLSKECNVEFYFPQRCSLLTFINCLGLFISSVHLRLLSCLSHGPFSSS